MGYLDFIEFVDQKMQYDFYHKLCPYVMGKGIRLAIELWTRFKIKMTVTSVFRFGDPGQHGRYNAFDFRTHVWSEKEKKSIAVISKEARDYLDNYHDSVIRRSKEVYDSLLFHDAGQGFHGHCQRPEKLLIE
jgi:hypothetical protein